MQLDITFIVQNKDYAQYLGECLNSILTQKHSKTVSYEIIGLDAGSQDYSREIYELIIGDFVDVAGLSQAEALNVALQKAKGKYIAWINSDDYYRPNYLKTHLATFKAINNQKVSLVYTKGWEYKQTALLLKWRGRYDLLEWAISKIKKRSRRIEMGQLKKRNIICQPTVMMKKDWLVKVGGWNEDVTYAIDYELWLRLAEISSFAYVPQCTAIVRYHGQNLGLNNREKVQKECKLIRRQHQKSNFHRIICLKST